MAEIEMGPYRVVRPRSSPHLRIYEVRSKATDVLLAVLTRAHAPAYGIREEWTVRCREPECTTKKEYDSRDRALTWLGYHRVTKHPQSMEKESA